MPYKSIFNSPTQPTGNKDYANDFVPGQYAKVNAGIAATHTAPIKAPKIQAATPPNGPTGFWNRMTEVGVGKVNLANLGKVIQKKPTVQSNSLKTDIHGAEKVGKGIGSFVKNTAVNTAKAAERVPADVTLAVANPIQRKLGVHQTTPQDLIKNKNNSSVLRGGAMEGSKGTLKQTAGDVIQTGTLATGGEGKVAEVTGEDLLKTFGTKGVQDLADKAGVDLAGKGSIEGAREVAQTKLGQQTFQKASSNALVRGAKSSVKGAAGYGTFSAAQEASAGGSNKQILKAGETGAKQGAVLGAGASLLKSGVKAVTNKTPTIEKGTASKEDVTPSPVNKLGQKAQARNALIGKKTVSGAQVSEDLAQPKTKLLGTGDEKVSGKGFTAQPSVDVTKVKLSARLNTINQKLNNVAQGKTTMASDDIKSLRAEKTSIGKVANGSAKIEDFKGTTGEIKVTTPKSKTATLLPPAKSPAESSTPVTSASSSTKLEEGSGTKSEQISSRPSSSRGKQVSGSALRTEAQAIESGMKGDFEDEATFSGVSHKVEAEKTAQEMHDDPDKVRAVALGEKPARNVSAQSAAYHAIKNKALSENDYDTMQQLVSAPRHSKISKAGQTLGAEAYHGSGDEDPISLMRQIADARTATTEKKMGTTVAKASSDIVKHESAKLESAVKPVNKLSWQAFVEGIKC